MTDREPQVEFIEPPRRTGYLSARTGAELDLCIRAKRERLVRAGAVPPLNDDERRQAAEGPVADSSLLDCARGDRAR